MHSSLFISLQVIYTSMIINNLIPITKSWLELAIELIE